MKSIAVIGGGASGTAAAIEAKRYLNEHKTDCEITVYEALNRIGKKILVTGNGKCNLLNKSTSAENYNGDRHRIESVFSEFDTDSNIKFFNSLGLMIYPDEAGRFYPLSNQASAVLDAIRFELDRLKINIVTDCKITSAKKQCKGFLLNGRYYADCIIFAGGGCSAPVHGSDGSALRLARELNIKSTVCVPALVPIIVKDFPKSLKGIRTDGKIEILSNGRIFAEADGEIQFTEYGFSGIPTMDVSFAASGLLNKNKKVSAQITLCPDLTENDIFNFILNRKKHNPDIPCENALTGIINKNLGIYKLKISDITPTELLSKIPENKLKTLAHNIKTQIFEISGVKDFTFSQVTSGGLIFSQFKNTLELKSENGIFASGEMFDVDAKCGGFNLQWAFSSGRTAGKNAAKYIIGE